MGLPDPEPDSLVGRTDPALDPILPSSSKNSKKNLYIYYFVTSLKNDVKDPLVKGTDPRIRTKMSRIRNTGRKDIVFLLVIKKLGVDPLTMKRFVSFRRGSSDLK